MQIDITHITVWAGRVGRDKVCLHTDIPSPYPLEVTSQPLDLDFDVPKGQGLAYVQKHFSGIETEVVDLSATREAGRPRFGQGRRASHPPDMTPPEKFGRGDSDD